MKNKKKSEDEVVRTLIETMFLIAGYPDITFEDILKEADIISNILKFSEHQQRIS